MLGACRACSPFSPSSGVSDCGRARRLPERHQPGQAPDHQRRSARPLRDNRSIQPCGLQSQRQRRLRRSQEPERGEAHDADRGRARAPTRLHSGRLPQGSQRAGEDRRCETVRRRHDPQAEGQAPGRDAGRETQGCGEEDGPGPRRQGRRVGVRTRELFWLPAGGVSDSKLDWKAIERALGATTTRTMGTIEQIAAKHFGA
jgi:hypothetical protein